MYFFGPWGKKKSEIKETVAEVVPEEEKHAKKRKTSHQHEPKVPKIAHNSHSHKEAKKKLRPKAINHPLFLNALKEFHEDITDLRVKQNAILVTSSDKSFKIFDGKSIIAEHPVYIYHNFTYNVPLCIDISKDYKQVICGLQNDCTIEVLEFENHQGKKVFNPKYKFGQNLHTSDFLDVFYINNEENVVSIAKGKDTKIKVWTIKGEQLFEFNTSGGEHFCCTSVFDLNLVFVGCWTSDIKVVELQKSKDKKSLKSFEKIHSLVGH